MEREQFLGRVQAALRGAVLPEIDGPERPPQVTFADPVHRFVETAAAVDAQVTRADSAPEAVAAALRLVDATAAGQDDRGYVAWEELDSLVPGLFDRLAAGGWKRIDATVGTDSRYEDHGRIGAASLGVTTADVAIAATGSVVLAHGPGRPRSASLLVAHHLVLLPVERIVSSLHEAMARVEWDTSNVVAITGPSRTGDIESILTLGVHGPRHLSIVLIG
ncbi:MAG: LUD domain-containing protein [Acidimicrobiia bacterium]|nr:LUD domain-containing protein [Acidimicrobiia bacterium]